MGGLRGLQLASGGSGWPCGIIVGLGGSQVASRGRRWPRGVASDHEGLWLASVGSMRPRGQPMASRGTGGPVESPVALVSRG
jgi:hypothetical protein